MTRPGPGKFEGNESLEVAEFLNDIAGSGMTDDQIGDVESFGWHALITDLDWFKTRDDLQGYSNSGMTWDELGNLKDALKPAYIVLEDNNGFFTYREFDSNDEARAEWKAITQEYLELMDNTDGVSVL